MTVFQNLPESIVVDGAEIPIHTDFRASIRFEELMQDPRLSDEARVAGMLSVYFDDGAAPVLQHLCRMGKAEALVAAILTFYRCGEPERPPTGRTERSYSFSADERRIYAAFSEQYGIDLYAVPYLHWWKFSAMFSGLSDTTEIARIMHIRAAKFEKGMTAKERAALRRAKRLYALPDMRTDEQRDDDFANAFAAGF